MTHWLPVASESPISPSRSTGPDPWLSNGTGNNNDSAHIDMYRPTTLCQALFYEGRPGGYGCLHTLSSTFATQNSSM